MEGESQRQRRRRRRRRMYRIRQRLIELSALVVLAAVIGIPVWLLCRSSEPPQTVGTQPPVESAVVEEIPAVVYPVDEGATGFAATVDAGSAVLVDITDNRVIAARGAERQVYPASVTKVMTVLVAVEHLTDYTATFEMPFEMLNQLFIEEATVAGFLAGEKVCMTDLLYGAILPSGADATQALAMHIAGSEEGFVRLMNEKAAEMGLRNTHFTNTSGLHDPDHYTTALDMAMVLREAMENPLCRQVLTAVTYTTAVTEQHPEGIQLFSTMFGRMYGTEPKVATIIGGKTGYTSQAGHTMASYAVGEDGHDYIFVSMQGSNRWEATYDAIEVYAYYCAPEGEKPNPTNYTP